MKPILFNTHATIAAAIVISCSSQVASAQSTPISANYLTGVWKENAQCHGGEAVVFFQNSTMSSAGSPAVNYTVSGPEQIIMYGPGGAVPVKIDTVNQNSMIMKFPGGATVVHRCGSSFNAQPSYNPNTVNSGISPRYIEGRWTNTGNCASPENFLPSGNFVSSLNQPGTWAIFGNTLRVTANTGNTVDFAVQINGAGNMTLTQLNQVNSVVNYIRC